MYQVPSLHSLHDTLARFTAAIVQDYGSNSSSSSSSSDSPLTRLSGRVALRRSSGGVGLHTHTHTHTNQVILHTTSLVAPLHPCTTHSLTHTGTYHCEESATRKLKYKNSEGTLEARNRKKPCNDCAAHANNSHTLLLSLCLLSRAARQALPRLPLCRVAAWLSCWPTLRFYVVIVYKYHQSPLRSNTIFLYYVINKRLFTRFNNVLSTICTFYFLRGRRSFFRVFSLFIFNTLVVYFTFSFLASSGIRVLPNQSSNNSSTLKPIIQ
jgi:hypothetical protein